MNNSILGGIIISNLKRREIFKKLEVQIMKEMYDSKMNLTMLTDFTSLLWQTGILRTVSKIP